MKKFITTLHKGSIALIYYIEIADNKRSFFFKPSIFNKESPEFILHLISGELTEEGQVEKSMLEQAKKEIYSMLSIDLMENINKHIAAGFM